MLRMVKGEGEGGIHELDWVRGAKCYVTNLGWVKEVLKDGPWITVDFENAQRENPLYCSKSGTSRQEAHDVNKSCQ